MNRPTSSRLARCLLLLWATLGVGCVQRTISITSEPQGALVHLNDQEVGRTPLTVPFTFYGTYDVRLQREGYKPLWIQQEAKSPWWELPGPDLVAEAIPDGKSEIKWHFDLEPEGEPSPDRLIDHARQMRSLVNQPQ